MREYKEKIIETWTQALGSGNKRDFGTPALNSLLSLVFELFMYELDNKEEKKSIPSLLPILNKLAFENLPKLEIENRATLKIKEVEDYCARVKGFTLFTIEDSLYRFTYSSVFRKEEKEGVLSKSLALFLEKDLLMRATPELKDKNLSQKPPQKI